MELALTLILIACAVAGVIMILGIIQQGSKESQLEEWKDEVTGNNFKK